MTEPYLEDFTPAATNFNPIIYRQYDKVIRHCEHFKCAAVISIFIICRSNGFAQMNSVITQLFSCTELYLILFFIVLFYWFMFTVLVHSQCSHPFCFLTKWAAVWGTHPKGSYDVTDPGRTGQLGMFTNHNWQIIQPLSYVTAILILILNLTKNSLYEGMLRSANVASYLLGV